MNISSARLSHLKLYKIAQGYISRTWALTKKIYMASRKTRARNTRFSFSLLPKTTSITKQAMYGILLLYSYPPHTRWIEI